MKYFNLQPGDPAPWFTVPSLTNPIYSFESVAGRYIVLFFFGSMSRAEAARGRLGVMARPDLFDDVHASFFGITNDRSDLEQQRLSDSYPGYRYLVDLELKACELYGVSPMDAMGKTRLMPRWFVLDPLLRVLKVIPCEPDGSEVETVVSYVASLPPVSRYAGVEMQAPVLILPHVFEPEFCTHLIDCYQNHGGTESGFMMEKDGKTVVALDASHKRRKDFVIEDDDLIKATQNRIQKRVVPEIRKAYQFHVTRMERYIVACYDAADAAHFSAHRDNTTKGTAHRRFAVSINLNDDFEGGEVSFPEFGPRGFRAPVGGAVVFSCSLLHAVSTVTRGRRFAFLPFLYDDAAARLRAENNAFLGEEVGAYTLT